MPLKKENDKIQAHVQQQKLDILIFLKRDLDISLKSSTFL